MAAELGQQTVEFSALVRRATEDSFLALKELVERSKAPEEQSDSEKKIELLKYIVKTRQRMLRLHVLAKWCQQVPLVQYCQQLSSTLSSHDTCFIQTADSLFYMHEGLQQARAPVFDVPSATEVLLTGNYQRLPKCIEDLGMLSVLSEDQQGPTLQKLNALLRSKLLEVSLPKEISEISVSDGTAVLRVDGEFKVILSLGYRGHLSLWRILHLELLVGEKNGPVKLEETRRYALGDDLERRMAANDNPFLILYTILHELCLALVMDTVIRQVQVLRQGRWKDAIRFELISDGSSGQGGNASVMQLGQDGELDSSALRTPGLKIFYWLDSEKTMAGSDSISSPFMKIEPGKDLQIKCLHSSFVIDPYTDKEAEFSLDQSCIDIEKLLLRAISCNKHTRLLEVQRELSKNVQICQTSGDVLLKRGGEFDVGLWKKDAKPHDDFYCGDEVLRVRAYGALYITLGINIRNGRFLLQSPKNNLEPSMLRDCEEALSQGSMTAAEVFTSLRGKSILHLFASTGKFLGLKVYEQCSSTMKIPKSILHGPDLLLMGFPQCGSSYYLLMQLDKDFKPLFKLLETQPDPDGHSHSIGDVNHVIRHSTIDISQMQMVEDEMNLSLINWDKLSSIPNLSSSNQPSDHVLSKLGIDPVLQLTGCSPSNFSSLVDEVFEFEKGSSGTFSIQNHNAALPVAPLPQFTSLQPNTQTIKVGTSSSKWEGGLQNTQIINSGKASIGVSSSASTLYASSSIKGLLNSSPSNLVPSSSPARSSPIQRLSTPKADQDPSSHKSPHSAELASCPASEEDQSSLMLECPKDVGNMNASRQTRLLSPLLISSSRNSALVTLPSAKSMNALRCSLTGDLAGDIRNAGSSSWVNTPICQTVQSDSYSSKHVSSRNERASRKRSLSDVLMMIPSVQGREAYTDMQKRRKIVDSSGSRQGDLQAFSSVLSAKHDEYVYGSLLSEANRGTVLSNIYVSALLHVIRHCSLSIKHARLTSQMDALDIPYVEEVGLRTPSSNLWFRLPFAMDDSWQNICLRLGKPGSMCWDVKINDKHFRELWELQKGSTNTPWGSCVRIANASDVDSHIRYDPEGVVLGYKTVEANSIEKLVSDLRRLSNARFFACGMRKLLGVRADDKLDDSNTSSDNKLQSVVKSEAVSEQVKRTFKIEAVGLMSLWFTYGTMPVTAHFVVEWESGKEGCTIHVSPDQLWPHTKFLEDYINGAEVASFLDCIRLTAGPLLALNHAIRPARMPGPVNTGPTPGLKQNTQGVLPNTSSVATQPSALMGTAVIPPLGNHNLHASTMLSAAGRGGPGIVPSSLLPIDVSVVLRGPYWIRIIYRKKFAVDMRCFAGDQAWLQPATPPKGGPAAGGSLPCPQFRPFIMEHVAQGLNALEPNFSAAAHPGGHLSAGNTSQNSTVQTLAQNGNRNVANSGSLARPTSGAGGQVANGLSRISNAMLASSGISTGLSGVPLRMSPGTGVPVHVRGELNTAFIGLGDDGGYGGGWVPLAALKKVLRGILKYLGVLWLFAQLPDLLKEILGSILKENEGSLLNLDQEQPALRFFVGGYVFAVSVHRVQLLLQVLSVKRFHHQQQQQQQTQSNTQEELTQTEITEICEYFSRRVASEPYDASRVASFITLLTLPISVLREFLKLIAWKKGLSQAHAGDIAPAQRARIELCLENHSGSISGDNSSSTRSNIHHDRAHNSVDFALTFVLDPAHIPHINAAGGAAWLPYCVSVRLKYSFGESTHISLLGMEGSHGGRSCWSRLEDWEKCKQRVVRTVEFANGNSVGDISQGRVRLAAEAIQRALQVSLQQLKDAAVSSSSAAT